MGGIVQNYHLEPPTGLMNDPNGFSYFGGLYHVFFQWNRFAKDHTHKEWGHFSSADLAHWNFEYSALLPDQPYDHSGVHSGSAAVVGDELLLYYTGSDKLPGVRRSHQCLASTQDLRTFLKEGVVADTPRGYTGHVRDPYVFCGSDGMYRMLLGAQRSNGKAAILLFVSADARTWSFAVEVARSDKFQMCECPDFVNVGDQQLLLYCPQYRDNDRDLSLASFSCYKPIALIEKRNAFESNSLDGGIPVDQGFDFYAPQTMTTESGRSLLIAWMSRLSEAQEADLAAAGPSIGCLTVPRELSWRDGKLCQQPVRELQSLRKEKVPWAREGDSLVSEPSTRSFWLRAEPGSSDSICISLNGGSEEIRYDASQKTLALSRTNWVGGGKEVREAQLDSLDELEVLSDRSSVELFANAGTVVMSARVMPRSEETRIQVWGLQDARELSLCTMSSR